MEDSYFRPFGLRRLSNQALYSADEVVVIYSRLRDPNMMKYVRNRAAWLGRRDLMIRSPQPALSDDGPIIQGREVASRAECSSEESHTMQSCHTPGPQDPRSTRPRTAKVAVADKENFQSELTHCGFSQEGKKGIY